jgi:cell division protease FtsH
MDGFEPNESLIVMAATNRPDILDTALLRPGRFDRRITVDLPSMKDRIEILKVHSRNKSLKDDVDLEAVAKSTPGFSGADLANMLNEAALLAVRKGKDMIESDDIEESRDKIVMGLERENLAITEEECRIIAYHEAGHAVVASVVPNADPVHKVTIVPRGHAMGSTHQLPEGDKYIFPKEYINDRLAVIPDGRREHVFLGEEIAERREYSEETAREVDEEIQNILNHAYERAIGIPVVRNKRDYITAGKR